MFRQRSGRARDVLGNCSEHLKNRDGRSGRAQAELGSEECTRRPSSSSLPNRTRRAKRTSSALEVKDSALTPSDGVNHGFMFGVGIVDKARAAMSEARE